MKERKYKRGEVGKQLSYTRLTIPEENKKLLVSSYGNIGLESLETRNEFYAELRANELER